MYVPQWGVHCCSSSEQLLREFYIIIAHVEGSTGEYLVQGWTNCVNFFLYCLTRAIRYSYTASCCGLSGIHEAVIQLEPRLLIE